MILENVAYDQNGLVTTLTQHYTQKALVQAYKLLGSLEVLGNPIEMVDSLGTGVKDFFYEPAKGLVKSPEAFGKVDNRAVFV